MKDKKGKRKRAHAFSTKKRACIVGIPRFASPLVPKKLKSSEVNNFILSQPYTSILFNDGHFEVCIAGQNVLSADRLQSFRNVTLGKTNVVVASSPLSSATIFSKAVQ